MSNSQTVSVSSLGGDSEELEKGFWQQWQQYQDYLYYCCIKWMGGNRTDAEDALSRAMLKAWEKVKQYAGKITNIKAWLTSLTHNLCVDIHRERSRGANRVEDIEAIPEEKELVQSENTPLSAVETDEKKIVIRRAIDNLPPRLRETFILHFYEELSYPEIVQWQEISYDNVCKRISQARKILRLELRGYFTGEDETDTELSVPPTATESPSGEISQEDEGVEPKAEETVTLSVAVAEVVSVEGEEAIEEVRDVQPSESVRVAATNDRKVEVNRDGCRCVEAALGERLLTPILALAQFEEEAGSWGNFCLKFHKLRSEIVIQTETIKSSHNDFFVQLRELQINNILGLPGTKNQNLNNETNHEFTEKVYTLGNDFGICSVIYNVLFPYSSNGRYLHESWRSCTQPYRSV